MLQILHSAKREQTLFDANKIIEYLTDFNETSKVFKQPKAM